MSSNPPFVDQFATLLNVAGNTFSVGLPEKRSHDVVTLAHIRAAEQVQKVASYLWRDMSILMRNTPFMAENAQDLWEYYQSLPLEQRPLTFVMFLMAREFVHSSGVCTREQCPKLCRVLDLYTGVLGLSCFVPRRVYYHIHKNIWTFQRSYVRSEVRGPETPLLLSAELQASVSDAADSAFSYLGLRGPSSFIASGGSNSGSSWSSWIPLLLASSLGAGAAYWLWTSKDLQQTRESVMKRFMQVHEQVNEIRHQRETPPQRPPLQALESPPPPSTLVVTQQ